MRAPPNERFKVMALRSLFTRKAAARPAQLKEFAECESSWATGTTRIHLRRTHGTELHKSGGLKMRNIAAACGTEVAWDLSDISREEVLAALPNQHESFHFCRDCLDFLGLQTHAL